MMGEYRICYLTKGHQRRFKCEVAIACQHFLNDASFITNLIETLEMLEQPPSLEEPVKIHFGGRDKTELQITVPNNTLKNPDASGGAVTPYSTPQKSKGTMHGPASTTDSTLLPSLMEQLSPFKAAGLSQEIRSPPRKKLNLSSDDEVRSARNSDVDEQSKCMDDWLEDFQALPDIAGQNSKFVQAVNLVNEDFVEEHFKKRLSRMCLEAGLIESLECVVVDSHVDTQNKAIVFELTSPNIAEWLLTKRSIRYDDREVIFFACDSADNDQRVSEGGPEEDFENASQPLLHDPFSKFIQAVNLLHEDYVEAHFTKRLTKICFEAGVTDSSDSVVVGSRVDTRNNTVVFELTSPVIVEWLLRHSSITYDNREIVFLACDQGLDTLNDNTASMPNTSSQLNPGTELRTTPPCSLHFDSPEGTTIFLRALLKFRRLFQGNDHSDGETQVQKELQKQGIEITVQEIKKKRRNLLNVYRRHKNKENVLWEYYFPCGVLTKDFPEEKLQGTEFDFWNEDKRRACLTATPDYENATFRKVAVWPVKCTEELLALYKQYKSEFDKPQNHSDTWYKIGAELYRKDRRMLYSGSQCENKWDALRSVYKNLRQKAEKTGAEGALRIVSSWPHYADMDELIGGDPSVVPPVTIAVGSANEMRRTSPPQDSGETGRVGKTRPSTLTRTSPNESALQRIAQSMEARNKLLAERNALLAERK